MNTRTWLTAIAAEVIIICCCSSIIFGIVFVTYVSKTDPTETVAVAQYPTEMPLPTNTDTPASTNTRVVPLSAAMPGSSPKATSSYIPTGTPTQAGANVYNISVPTPTAPPIKYPVAFDSTLKVITYSVAGKTLDQISKSLEAHAIPDKHEPNSHYYAQTEWSVAWSSYSRQSINNCELDRSSITIAITMTLPALATTNEVTQDILKRWDTFLDKTIIHENGHVQISLQGARDIQRDVGNLLPALNCPTLERNLNSIYKRDFDSIDRDNVEYDTKTNHGMTQGAVFP